MIDFVKFIFVGILNTAIDLLVLNLLVFVFGTGSHGGFFVVFKSISFLAAVSNSYLMNKYWVFKSENASRVRESGLFLTVSVIGFLLNIGVSSLAFFVLHGIYNVSAHLGANLAAITGTCVVFIWNFVGYKFFVFSKKYV